MGKMIERYIPILTGVTLGLAFGFLWNGSFIALSLVFFVPVVGFRLSPAASAVYFLAYYLAGCRSIPQFVPVFFPDASHYKGILYWVLYAVVLSLPWIVARNLPVSTSVKLIIAYSMAILPPLYPLGVLSPLFSAGGLFPGTGLVGLATVFFLQAWWGTRRILPAEIAFAILVSIGLNLVMNIDPPRSPANWIAINTVSQPRSLLNRPPWERKLAHQAEKALDHGNRVILLPESVAELWSGKSLPWPWNPIRQEAIRRNAVVLVGSETPVGNIGRIWDDDLVELGKRIRFFPARQPVPIAGWNPLSKIHHERAHWFRSGVYRIGGLKAEVSLCYEDLLIGPHLWAAIFDHPQVILSSDNLWFAQDTSEPDIQGESIRAWGRLLGESVMRTVNH